MSDAQLRELERGEDPDAYLAALVRSGWRPPPWREVAGRPLPGRSPTRVFVDLAGPTAYRERIGGPVLRSMAPRTWAHGGAFPHLVDVLIRLGVPLPALVRSARPA